MKVANNKVMTEMKYLTLSFEDIFEDNGSQNMSNNHTIP